MTSLATWRNAPSPSSCILTSDHDDPSARCACRYELRSQALATSCLELSSGSLLSYMSYCASRCERHTVSVCIDIACVLFAIVPFWSPGRVFILPLRIRSTDPVIIVSTHPESRTWRLPSLLSPVKGAVSFALFVLYFFYSPSIFLLCSTSLRLPSSASFTRELSSLCAHAPVFDLQSVLFRAAGPLPTRR